MSTRQHLARRRFRQFGWAVGAFALAGSAAIWASGASAAQPAPAAGNSPETVAVVVDHAKVIRLPENAQTVIVGNPGIADVAIQKNGVMVVTGKSFGVTNLIALDAGGKLLAESLVRVGAAVDSMVTVQRGLDRETYSCTPVCQPSVQLGDTSKFFDERGNQVASRNNFATGTPTK